MELSKKKHDDIWQICDTNPEYAVAIVTSFLDALGVMSKTEFKEVTGINPRTIDRHCNSGKIPNILGMPLLNVYEKIKNDKS